MALVLKDRVKETTTTTGTGTYTLAGAVTGFEAFSSVGDGNTTYYSCTDGTDFEVGIGTYTASGTTLARTTILQSSNSDSAVSWSSGTKTIFCAQPAEKAVFLNASNNIKLGDNEEIILGASDDLKIKHTGSRSVISDTGTGGLRLSASADLEIMNSAATETKAKFTTDGSVELYHDNVKKLETTSGGIDVTGTVTDDGATHDGDVTFTGDNYNIVFDKSDDALEFADNAKAKFGASDDLVIFHDGSNSRIKDEGTGSLLIGASFVAISKADGSEDAAKFFMDGAVELYHDNSKKLETTADGINVTSTTDDGPIIDLISDDPSDINDFAAEGQIRFLSENDASESTLFAKIVQRTADVSDGTENGAIYYGLTTNGTHSEQFAMLDGGFFLLHDNSYIEFNLTRGTNFDVQLFPTTPTADRQITLPDATGTVALTSDLGTIASQAADSVNIDGGAVDGITLGTNSAVTEAQIDNININGNDITTTNSNGAIGITPNGTGDVFLGTDTVHIGNFNSNAKITTNGTGDLTLNTNSGTNSGSIVIADGANGNISITPDGTGSVVITSTDAGSGDNPSIILKRDSSSPADFDNLGNIDFVGENDASQEVTYASISGMAADVSDGTEDGRIRISTIVAGSSVDHTDFIEGFLEFRNEQQIRWHDQNGSFACHLAGGTPTADRTITLPDATGTVALTSDIADEATALAIALG